MSSVRGFRCQRCRAELLAAAEVPGQASLPEWTPPILCCGGTLCPLPPDQMLAELLVGALARGRVARCPRCGYRVRLVVHPAGTLVCMICQREFELGAPEANTREGPGALAAARDERPLAVAEASGVLPPNR